MKKTTQAVMLVAAAFLSATSNALVAEDPKTPPDLTQNTKVDRERTYNLGVTGLRGWIYTRAANFFESVQGRTTTASRQILVTHVGKDSPADGVMQVDDVILGAGGKLFVDDARKSFARAIQETEQGSGILRLTRWRLGKTEEVELKLRVLGKYSGAAPYDCLKSKEIFAKACKYLEKEPLQENLWGAVNSLALLSTGNPDYLPRVRDFARKMGPAKMKLTRRAFGTWETGYRNLFLCEYYLLTRDKEVLPAIRELTLALARGQGMYGTFGHGFCDLTPEGKLHGSIPPYGPVNVAGVVANLAIVMGKRCGVEDPEVDVAIERASKFFGYYIDKGMIPYGEHEPFPYHETNGKSAVAALFYALQGQRNAEAQFWAKMCTASYQNREIGHTGQGFSYLWGALGVNVGGPEAMAAFFKEASWHFDLVRRCDGSFTYDGGEQYGPGKTEDNTYYGKSGYYGLSPNATYVLTYSLPLKKLLITGRDANQATWLSQKIVDGAIASGRFDLERKTKNTQELVKALGDWSPIARSWAAEELAGRPEAQAMIPQLLALAEGKDGHVRQGACETLGILKTDQALPVFVRLLAHEDRWLRYKAAWAIKNMGAKARPAIPDILKQLVATNEPLEPISWADPLQLAHGQLAAALFSGPLINAVKETEPRLLYPAIRVLANNPDGMARAHLRGFFENKLTAEDVQALAPEIFAAIKTPSPADRMFSNEIRMGGFKALTKYHFKEGLEAGIIFAKTQGGHGSESRTGVIMKEIVSYGAAAKDVLPDLRALIDQFNAECKAREFPDDCNKQRVTSVEEAIKAIEAATTQPKLRRIALPSHSGRGDGG